MRQAKESGVFFRSAINALRTVIGLRADLKKTPDPGKDQDAHGTAMPMLVTLHQRHTICRPTTSPQSSDPTELASVVSGLLHYGGHEFE